MPEQGASDAADIVLPFTGLSKISGKRNRHLNYSVKSSAVEEPAGKASWCDDSVDTWKVSQGSPGERARRCRFQAKGNKSLRAIFKALRIVHYQKNNIK